jgi:hypothetical protein
MFVVVIVVPVVYWERTTDGGTWVVVYEGSGGSREFVK